MRGLGDDAMQHLAEVRTIDQQRALWTSTIAFTVCFAVWTIFSIIGVQIKKDLGLNDTQFGLLVGTSSGANVTAALRVAQEMGPSCNIVTILCDRAERYFSTRLFATEENKAGSLP